MEGYAGIGFSIASLVILVIMIKHGYTEKLYAASALFLRLALSFILAMTFYKPLAYLITKHFAAVSEYLVLRVSFLVILWGSYVAWTELYERLMEPEHVQVPRGLDHLGGMVFGALAGVVLVGCILLTYSFIPYARVVAGPVPKLWPLDMGEILIEEYANLSNRMDKPGRFDRRREIQAYHDMHEEAPPAPAPEAAAAPAAPAAATPEASPDKSAPPKSPSPKASSP